jgi:integrase
MGTTRMLTASAVKAAKPREKLYKLADSRGLALLVKPNGAKLWRFRYVFDGREKMISLGRFPDTSLRSARIKRDKARRLLEEEEIDPSADRKAKREAQKELFKHYLEPWAERHGRTQRESTRARDARIVKAVDAELGKHAIVSITAADVIDALQAILERHGRDFSDRAHSIIRRVLAAPLTKRKLSSNPAAGIDRNAILGKRAKAKKRPGIVEPKRFAELLRAIDGYQGSPVTRAALKIQARLFVRPQTELLKARWSEIDFGASLWTIPAERMKMGRRHLVPLSWQVALLLGELSQLTHAEPNSYVFASHIAGRPLSENTLNGALRRLDFDTKTEHSSHGFRTSASTMLRERLQFRPSAAIEAQLAHKEPGVASLYNEAEYLDERASMMQQWSDYLDDLTKKEKP